MSTHKHIDKICCIVLAFTLVLTALFIFSEAFGLEAASRPLGYESRLFSTDKVHSIDIIIDDWDGFISTAQSEEYSVCSVVIDGEAVKNVGIRGKGNTSLSSVASMDSERYSFKIEFDQYDSTKTYHGLDKLSLNNVIQDNTYMKDYLVYQMMNEFGVAAPLCSYAYITVNGEDWGLYLAVEGVEEAFLGRNYGYDYGELYKPDSMSFGGGRGQGKDFDISDFMGEDGSFDFSFGDGNNIPDIDNMPNIEKMLDMSNIPDNGNMPNMPFGNPSSTDGEQASDNGSSVSRPSREQNENGFEKPDMGNFGGMGGFGMGSSDVKLQYIDDNPTSYSNIFNNAKTDITEADQNRLISSLRQLSEYDNIEEVVDTEAVLRYFVVHNYVVNGDSYTGNMIHNYYLYEKDGRLSMIPWDYNLAFGTFQGSNASSSVNDSIDEVLSDRPMQAWIFSDEAYSSQYFEMYSEFIESVDAEAIIEKAYELISPYVSKDPTAFCTYDEFQAGVNTLKQFCSLRSESVRLQLDGSDETVDTGTLDISDMGTMGSGIGGSRGQGKDFFNSQERESSAESESQVPEKSSSSENVNGIMPTSFNFNVSGEGFGANGNGNQPQMPWGDGEMPNIEDFAMENMPQPGGMQFPGNTPPSGQMPGGNFQGGQVPSDNSQGEQAPSDSVQGEQVPSDNSQDEQEPSNNSQGGQRPNGSFQQGGQMPGGSFPGGDLASTNTDFSSSSELLMLIVSVIVLVGGLVFAFLFKRRK